MFFFQFRKRPLRPLLFPVIGLILSLTIFFSYSIPVYADDPSAPAFSDPPEPSVRTSDAPSDATVSLAHTHRGDSSMEGQCYTVPVLHQHSGDPSSGGPCYSPVYHSHSSSCYGTCEYHPISHHIASITQSYCQYHGEVERITYTVRISHNLCGMGVEYRNVTVECHSCGSNIESGATGSHSYLRCSQGGTIVGYNRTCGKDEGETIDYYDPGCGLEVRSYGSMTLTNATPEWTTGNVTLTGTVDDPEGVISDGGFGIMSFRAESGEIAEEGSDSVIVSENGVYVMDITVDEARFDTASASVMLNVSNIDRTAPTINDVSYDQGDTWLHSNEITVTASDPQPDGTPGSGLADEAYSFDGGSTWQSSPTYSCTQHGTVEIRVRDYCGNIAETSVEITNVDNSGPDVSYIFSPTVWYEGEGARQYTFTAADEESGLPELPFSYDGGETWTDEIILSAPYEGTITVLIRDNLDNITELTIINKHSIRPKNDDDDYNGKVWDDEEPSGDSVSSGTNAPIKDIKKDKTDDDTDQDNDDSRNQIRNHGAVDNADNNDDGGISPENMHADYDPSPDENGSTVYFEQFPTSSAGVDIPGQDTLREHTPFYRTKAFKAAASIGGGLAGTGILLGLVLLLYSGVIIYTYDGNKYRLTGIRPIRRSERGNYIFLSTDFMDSTYSSKYKMALGPVYVRRHADDLLSINAAGDWTSVNVERYIYTIL